MQNRYEFTLALAKEAGDLVLKSREKHINISIKNNDPRDILTNVDIEVSNLISSAIRKEFPEEAIYSEEATGEDISSHSFWAIDPIDGTSNFSKDIPHYSTVIAYVDNGVPVVGVVYNPMTNELFSFEKGKGAFLNGKTISASKTEDFLESTVLFTTGRKPEHWDWAAKFYRSLLGRANKVRIMGSSGLDICYVASGRVEACVYKTLTTVDVIAALGILKEAGGILEGPDGPIDGLSKTPQMILAVNNQKMLEEIKNLI